MSKHLILNVYKRVQVVMTGMMFCDLLCMFDFMFIVPHKNQRHVDTGSQYKQGDTWD